MKLQVLSIRNSHGKKNYSMVFLMIPVNTNHTEIILSATPETFMFEKPSLNIPAEF